MSHSLEKGVTLISVSCSRYACHDEMFTHPGKRATGNFRAIELLLQDHRLQTHAQHPTIRAAGKHRYITTDFSVNKTSVN